MSEGVSDSESYAVSESNIYGLGVFLGLSFQLPCRRLDEVKRLAYQYLAFERDRIAQMLAQGSYHILCAVLGDKATIAVAKALIHQAYTPTRLYPEPLKAVEDDSEFTISVKTLSFDLRRGNI